MQDLYPLIESEVGERYILVENLEGKVWAFPEYCIRKGMAIYQPSAWKGRLLKALLPFYAHLPLKKQRMGICIKRLAIDKNFKMYLEKSDMGDYRISVFYGSPGPNRKTTVQVYNRKDIKAYIKVTFNEKVYQFFIHEDRILEYLKKCKIEEVPATLGVLHLGDKYLFGQTSLKPGNSKIQYRLGKVHWDFLFRLYTLTGMHLSFEDTDFACGLNRFCQIKELLTGKEQELLAETIRIFHEVYGGKQVKFSLYHGDFTPWNTVLRNSQLYVFDFEYAQYTYPPFTDIFHFFTQTALFIKHASEERIWEEYSSLRENAGGNIFNEKTDILYMVYLTDIILTYKKLQMDTGIPISDKTYKTWFYLLDRLVTGYGN